MQHVTVIIARKRWDCITMGWSRLLLVKKKNNKNNKNNNKGFRSWLEATHADDVVHMDDIFRIIDTLFEDVSPVSCTCIMELFGVYIKFLSCGSGNLSTFWMSYMDMIEILQGLIRASREGDGMLHLASHMTGWNMHAISHATTPIYLSCTQRTQMCTMDSCKDSF